MSAPTPEGFRCWCEIERRYLPRAWREQRRDARTMKAIILRLGRAVRRAVEAAT